MNRKTYIEMTSLFRNHPKMAKVIHILNKMITGILFLAYPVLILYYFSIRNDAVIRMILVPLDGFIIVTVFRYLVNRQRPYEKFQIPSVIPKDTKGKSFPSRHVFSAFIISMTYLVYSPWQLIGIGMLVLSCILGIIRVVSGVHFISDVIAGAAFGIIVGMIGYFVI